jgi:hypothetical protein
MRRIVIAAGLVALAMPATAQADKADCSPSLERSYSNLYRTVAKRHGVRAPGRNIRRDGVRFRGVTFEATCGELRRSRSQLRRLAHRPSERTLRTEAVQPAQPPAGVKSAQVDGIYEPGGWAIPEHIVRCESGGDYSASNPSGAYGAYQIMPGTAAAYGCSLATPAGQDACAARIYAREGAAPWDCG